MKNITGRGWILHEGDGNTSPLTLMPLSPHHPKISQYLQINLVILYPFVNGTFEKSLGRTYPQWSFNQKRVLSLCVMI